LSSNYEKQIQKLRGCFDDFFLLIEPILVHVDSFSKFGSGSSSSANTDAIRIRIRNPAHLRTEPAATAVHHGADEQRPDNISRVHVDKNVDQSHYTVSGSSTLPSIKKGFKKLSIF